MALLIIVILVGIAAAVMVVSSAMKTSTPEEPVNRPGRPAAR